MFRGYVGGQEFDCLGFAAPFEGDATGEAAYAFGAEFRAKAQRRLKRIESRRARLKGESTWSALEDKELKYYCRKGLPQEYRAEVWWSLLRCEEHKRESPDSYEHLLSRELDAKVKSDIETDLARTFPDHIRFRTSAGQAELRNVLRAFALSFPSVGYCQGLNFIAGMMILVFESEERSFWAMASAFKRLDVSSYYLDGMKSLRADMKALSTALAKKCPKVAARLDAVGVDLLSICSEWYITWFAKSLPAASLLRVWDVLFLEGDKVFFRVAVGIFQCAEKDILGLADFEDVMRDGKKWAHQRIDHNELMKASFPKRDFRPLRRRELSCDRNAALADVEREDAEMAQRRAEAAARRPPVG